MARQPGARTARPTSGRLTVISSARAGGVAAGRSSCRTRSRRPAPPHVWAWASVCGKAGSTTSAASPSAPSTTGVRRAVLQVSAGKVVHSGASPGRWPVHRVPATQRLREAGSHTSPASRTRVRPISRSQLSGSGGVLRGWLLIQVRKDSRVDADGEAEDGAAG